MPSRIKTALSREVRMPRWAIALDFVWRTFLGVSALVVIVLWFQAATRDEEADRNARIQACSAGYAATTAAWDAEVTLRDQESESHDRHAETLFSRLVVGTALSDGPLPRDLLDQYETAQEQAEETTALAKQAARKVREMTRLRIGLAEFSTHSVAEGNEFVCPPLPDDLMVRPVEVGE